MTVPHFRRGDVTREVDLIEEVARIDGLERLPATLPPRRGAGRAPDARAARAPPRRGRARRARHLRDRRLELRRPGAARPPAAGARGSACARVVTIENPLSEAISILRPTLLGSLLRRAAHNRAHGAADLALFESGTVYRAAAEGPLAARAPRLGALRSELLRRPPGAASRRRAPTSSRQGAARDALLDALGVAWTRRARPSARSCIAGRSAAVLAPAGARSASSASWTR